MIEKHYASRLTNLMGVDELHSFKAKPKRKAPDTAKVPEAEDIAGALVKEKAKQTKRVKASRPQSPP